MDVLADQSITSNNSPVHEVAFLYRLVPGRATASYALFCAHSAGLDDAILKRAMEVCI